VGQGKEIEGENAFESPENMKIASAQITKRGKDPPNQGREKSVKEKKKKVAKKERRRAIDLKE